MDPIIEPAREDDLSGLERLLASAKLPPAGLRQCLDSTLVARAGDRIIGSAALEIYPSGVLLRSVAVDDGWRRRGLGKRLTDAALALARRRGATAAFLLTVAAPEFFSQFGFTPVDRADVPEDVRRSVQFTDVCPSSAVAMRAYLGGA